MKHAEPRSLQSRLASPGVFLGGGLAIAVAMIFLPSSLTQSLRDGWREALLPGLQVINSAAAWTGDRWSAFHGPGNVSASKTQQQIAELNNRVHDLQLQLQLAQSNRNSAPLDDSQNTARLPALLVSQAVSARVLGRQAQSFLQAGDVLDVGKSHGITAHALVVENSLASSEPQVLDQGRDAGIAQGSMVLAGARIWGKITEVGPHTSTVQRVTDNGYRDLVQLASPRDGRLHFAASGVLVGHGERLCKVELVETSEPITVGDLVFSADDGVLDVPLLYGRVARLERKSASGHWEIWMEPALPESAPPARVAVLEMKVNPARLAGAR
jgi:cell shape-determining protein MreC